MERMTLTDTQKSRLLRMCKHLYKNYTHISFGSYSNSNFIYFIKGQERLDESTKYHWFELCCTSLLLKISRWSSPDKEDNTLAIGFFGNCLLPYGVDRRIEIEGEPPSIKRNHKEHPVDYLYNEYKKLTSKTKGITIGLPTITCYNNLDIIN